MFGIERRLDCVQMHYTHRARALTGPARTDLCIALTLPLP